jgi:hypothetical protein
LVPSAFLPACQTIPITPRNFRIRGTTAGHGRPLHAQLRPPEDRRGEHEGAAEEPRHVVDFSRQAIREAAGGVLAAGFGLTQGCSASPVWRAREAPCRRFHSPMRS